MHTNVAKNLSTDVSDYINMCSPFGGSALVFHTNVLLEDVQQAQPFPPSLTMIGFGGDLSAELDRAREGIRLIQSVRPSAHRRAQGFKYVLDLRAEWDDADLWAEVRGIKYHRIPGYDDGRTNTAEWWDTIARWWVDEAEFAPVYVHCHLGVNRAPAVALLLSNVLFAEACRTNNGEWASPWKCRFPQLTSKFKLPDPDGAISLSSSPYFDFLGGMGFPSPASPVIWGTMKTLRNVISPKYISQMLQYLLLESRWAHDLVGMDSRNLSASIERKISAELDYWDRLYRGHKDVMIRDIKYLREIEAKDLETGRDRRH